MVAVQARTGRRQHARLRYGEHQGVQLAPCRAWRCPGRSGRRPRRDDPAAPAGSWRSRRLPSACSGRSEAGADEVDAAASAGVRPKVSALMPLRRNHCERSGAGDRRAQPGGAGRVGQGCSFWTTAWGAARLDARKVSSSPRVKVTGSQVKVGTVAVRQAVSTPDKNRWSMALPASDVSRSHPVRVAPPAATAAENISLFAVGHQRC